MAALLRITICSSPSRYRSCGADVKHEPCLPIWRGESWHWRTSSCSGSCTDNIKPITLYEARLPRATSSSLVWSCDSTQFFVEEYPSRDARWPREDLTYDHEGVVLCRTCSPSLMTGVGGLVSCRLYPCIPTPLQPLVPVEKGMTASFYLKLYQN